MPRAFTPVSPALSPIPIRLATSPPPPRWPGDSSSFFTALRQRFIYSSPALVLSLLSCSSVKPAFVYLVVQAKNVGSSLYWRWEKEKSLYSLVYSDSSYRTFYICPVWSKLSSLVDYHNDLFSFLWQYFKCLLKMSTRSCYSPGWSTPPPSHHTCNKIRTLDTGLQGLLALPLLRPLPVPLTPAPGCCVLAFFLPESIRITHTGSPDLLLGMWTLF